MTPFLSSTAAPEHWSDQGPRPITIAERMAWWGLGAVSAAVAAGAVTGIAILWLQMVAAYWPIAHAILFRVCIQALAG